ncbi:MAG: hypothetical protein H6765_04350 [Candidatus Peribacteria bacterium]|nr:MAG: hypothetical protein H6765_04350 [Candidatus Peribacteria bacterium]
MIQAPIMHHADNPEKMVVVISEQSKGRGREHQVTTECQILAVDAESTWLLITIAKGIRHQIRAHLSAIGYPILGDVLYSKKAVGELQLWSVGANFL